MTVSLKMMTYLVSDYDEAIDYFVNCLGFELIEDTVLNAEKRWVRVAAGISQLLLAKASDDAQIQSIGNQTGGRVGFFLQSDDFDQDVARMKEAGVHFIEDIRHESYGRVVVFRDLYGNKWDLLEN